MNKSIFIINQMIKKAQAGEEAGEFRGGDPEELQRKREEKRQEKIDSGGLENQDDVEEPDPADVEEFEEKEKQKLEDAGKSLVQKASEILSLQVSPVDTFGDYQPRDANGDPIENKLQNMSDKYKAPGPIRQGKNQDKVWSEVLGTKIPLTGDPTQYLRRFEKRGDYAGMEKESDKLMRSGILWCLDPSFCDFRKGIGDQPRGGKYIRRWWDNDRWNYQYFGEKHPTHHGLEHTGRVSGHTIDIHPDVEKYHPNASPEKAYEYTLRRKIAEKGSMPIREFDEKQGRMVDKVLFFPGNKANKKGSVVHNKEGMPELGSIAAYVRDPHPTEPHGEKKGQKTKKDLTGLKKYLRNNNVTTEYDIEGNPWVHWRHAISGKGMGRPQMMYDPKSRFSPKDDKRYNKFGQSSNDSIESLRKWILEQKGDPNLGVKGQQTRMKEEEEKRSIPADERKVAHDWEPEKYKDMKGNLKEATISHLIEQGKLGTWSPIVKRKTIEAKDLEGNPVGTREHTRKTWEFKFDNPEERSRTTKQLHDEHYRKIKKLARDILASHNLLDRDKYTTEARIHSLTHETLPNVIESSMNTYDPNKGHRYSTHLMNHARGYMEQNLPKILGHEMAYENNIQREKKIHRERMRRAGKSPEEIRDFLRKFTEKTKQDRVNDVKEYQQHELGKQYEDLPSQVKFSGEKPEYMSEPVSNETLSSFDSKLRENLSDKDYKNFFNDLKDKTYEERDSLFQNRPVLYHIFNKKFPGVHKSFSLVLDLIKADSTPLDEEESEEHSKYLWRQGEPGAYKYMWSDPSGEVIQMTNAPKGHPHFDSEKSDPVPHPDEPNQEDHPEMFDILGRKLHRGVPEDKEPEYNTKYHPEANHWVAKYTDDDTGQENYVGLYRDRVKNDKLSFNEDIRHVDAQLEKFRSWYTSLLNNKNLTNQALGLLAALIDQANTITGGPGTGIADLKIGNITQRGNVFQLSMEDHFGGKHMVSVSLDPKLTNIFHKLAEGKNKSDYLFEVNGIKIDQEPFTKFMNDKLGISPQQIRVYQATKLFSEEFQKLAAKKENLSPEDLNDLFNEALVNVSRLMGHISNDSDKLSNQIGIDPITIETLFMSAIHHHNPEINKSLRKAAYKLDGKLLFQGLPISIENKKGSTRNWYDPHEKKHGKTTMQYDYGYIRGTKGTDLDHVDVYVGPHKDAKNVFVIHQMKSPDFKEFDEDKTMVGFNSGKEAKRAYLAHYDNPKFFGSMTILPMEKFKEKVFKTKNNPKMIKSLNTVSGPIVWHVSSKPEKRTSEEKIFGDWIHSHPMHEHDQQWMAFKHATRIPDPPKAPTGRELAGDYKGSKIPGFEEPESNENVTPDGQNTIEKSLIDKMIQAAA